MKLHIQTAVSVAVTALVLAGCSSMGARTMDSDAASADTSADTSASMDVASDFPAGRYQRGDTVVVFNPNDTFVGTTPEGNDWVRGTYTHSGNEFTATDTWESEDMIKNGNSCMGVPGRYSWALSGDTFIAHVIDDACEGRKKGTDGVAWTRMH